MNFTKLTIAITFLMLCSKLSWGQSTADLESSSYQFYYEDIIRFKEVIEIVENGGDTLNAIQQYFANGSVGMKAWIQRYEVEPERIYKTIKYFPSYYKYLSELAEPLRSFESQISNGFNGLKKLYPSDFVHIPPVYYFILFSGGGSVEMTANMISVDYFGMHEHLNVSEFDRIGGLYPTGPLALIPLAQIPQVAIHETAHLLQAYAQGEFDYVSIYEDENRTVLSYLIREGGADFLTYLAANMVDSIKYSYGEMHEQELWESIQPILSADPYDNPGWFSGQSPQHPEWPFQIGYYLGYKIVAYFYEKSDNKEAAIKQILNSHTKEDFQQFIEAYKEKWKE